MSDFSSDTELRIIALQEAVKVHGHDRSGVGETTQTFFTFLKGETSGEATE